MDLDLTSEITEILNSELASDATLTTASPAGSASVRIFFDKSYAPKDIGEDVDWSGYNFFARGLAATFTDAKQNDSLLIGGVTYNIEDKYETEEGWCVMPLTINNVSMSD